MPEYPIDLGRKSPGCCAVEPMSSKSEELFYPSVYIDLPEPGRFPEEGTVTFKYKLVRSSEDHKRDTASAELELTQIVDTKAAKSDEPDEKVSDKLDRYKKEIEVEEDEE